MGYLLFTSFSQRQRIGRNHSDDDHAQAGALRAQLIEPSFRRPVKWVYVASASPLLERP